MSPATLFLSKPGKLNRKKTLKTVSEGEIRVDTDEYSIYECIIEVKT